MATTCAHEPQPTVQELGWLIDAEYREMPGMRLTFAQICRLWSLSADQCGRVLDYLLRAGLLARDEDSRYYRNPDSH